MRTSLLRISLNLSVSVPPPLGVSNVTGCSWCDDLPMGEGRRGTPAVTFVQMHHTTTPWVSKCDGPVRTSLLRISLNLSVCRPPRFECDGRSGSISARRSDSTFSSSGSTLRCGGSRRLDTAPRSSPRPKQPLLVDRLHDRLAGGRAHGRTRSTAVHTAERQLTARRNAGCGAVAGASCGSGRSALAVSAAQQVCSLPASP